jgi:hypothetical protein
MLVHMPVFLHTLAVICQADLESLPIFMSKYEMTVLSWNYVKVDTFSCTEQFRDDCMHKTSPLTFIFGCYGNVILSSLYPLHSYLPPPPSISIHSPYSLSHLQWS